MSAGLLLIAATIAAPPAPAGLQRGDLFRYAGTVVEEVRRPGKEFCRKHNLELNVLVLNQTDRWVDTIVLTRLKRTNDAVTNAAGVTTRAPSRKDLPPFIHLDFVRVYSDGTLHLLSPQGPAPLRLDDRTPARALPLIPINAFAAAELGVFPPRPPREHGGEPWPMASGPTRPAETWRVAGSRFFNAEHCDRLLMTQESADWTQPTGGTAWHRADEVWASTLDGMARKVHRLIRQRDGRVESPPAAWVEVSYELKEQSRLTGRTLDRARRNVETAYCAFADATQPLGTRLFEARLAKLDAAIRDSDGTGPFTEALAAARRTLESARDGDVIQPAILPAAGTTTAPVPWPEPGQVAPDFRAGDFRLAHHRGKPVVLVFLKPGGTTTSLALTVADALQKRYGDRVTVVPLVVFGDVATAVAARDRLNLTIPLLPGGSAAATYGVTTVPRFALIDGAAKVRWTFTGIGAETGYLAREEVDRLVSPASPNGPPRTIVPPGPIAVPIVPPP